MLFYNLLTFFNEYFTENTKVSINNEFVEDLD